MDTATLNQNRAEDAVAKSLSSQPDAVDIVEQAAEEVEILQASVKAGTVARS
ncbi:MAG TPA: hypothetical protein VMP68_26030 [Candidatus Eisenbacteria bacterium]|nr:hypothetical protein [Candidatus Eisenbacteria bacterium]